MPTALGGERAIICVKCAPNRPSVIYERSYSRTMPTPRNAASSEYPLDEELFGPLGAATRKLCADLTKDADKREYRFVPNDEFAKISERQRAQQIYWQEMLSRAHWAAMLNLLRHARWQTGCVAAYQPPGNFLSFTANLRGLIEAALDAQYSLGTFPMTLADNYTNIQTALQGKLNGALVSPEVEDLLIHFVYARKLTKLDQGPITASHQALEPKGYRNGLDLPAEHRKRFGQIYDDLCGFCHPTAIGLIPFWKTLPSGAVRIAVLDDRAAIKAFYDDHQETVQFALSLSVTTSALCLRTMNRFAFPDVRCDAIESWSFTDVPAWRKIEEKLDVATRGSPDSDV